MCSKRLIWMFYIYLPSLRQQRSILLSSTWEQQNRNLKLGFPLTLFFFITFNNSCGGCAISAAPSKTIISRSAGWWLVEKVPAETGPSCWTEGECGSSKSSVMVYSKAFKLEALCRKTVQHDMSDLSVECWFWFCSVERRRIHLLRSFSPAETSNGLLNSRVCVCCCRGIWNEALLLEHLLSPAPAPPLCSPSSLFFLLFCRISVLLHDVGIYSAILGKWCFICW